MTRPSWEIAGGGSPGYGWEPPWFERVMGIILVLALIASVYYLLRGPA